MPYKSTWNDFQLIKLFLLFILKHGLDGFGSAGSKSFRALAVFGAGVSGLLSFATIAYSDEAEHGLECPSYPWPHEGILSSYDHAS